jgi:hypothetical protein
MAVDILNEEQGGAVDTEALPIGSVILILALVPFLLASRRFEMPTGNDYSDLRLDKSQSVERQENNLGVSGEYGYDRRPADFETPTPTSGVYPDVFPYSYDANNSQFSQDKEGDPVRLMEQTRASIQKHADLNYAYGLCQPVADLGSHPWLRDSLATPGEKEPGDAPPETGSDTPFRR